MNDAGMESLPKYETDAFSPKRVLISLQRTFVFLKRRWFKIFLVAMLLGFAAAGYSLFKKPQYIAEITFTLDEGADPNARNGLSEMEDIIGIGTSFQAGGVFSSITNIVELLQSRLMVEKALYDSVNVHGKPLTLANFFLDSLNYRDKWLKKTSLYHFDFGNRLSNEQDSLLAGGIMRSMYELIISKYLKVESKGKGTTIVSVTCTSENELFSKYFLETLLREVTEFYVESKTFRARSNLDFIQNRVDSVRSAYYAAMSSRASLGDALANPNRQIAAIGGERQQTQVQVLKSSYIELAKEMELAKTSLMRDTPLIQYLDIPLLPLKSLKSSLLKWFGIGFFLGAFLSAAYLLIKRIFTLILSR